MDIDTQNEYTEYSHNEIINRCKFGNNHNMQTRLLSEGSIFKQQDQDGILTPVLRDFLFLKLTLILRDFPFLKLTP